MSSAKRAQQQQQGSSSRGRAPTAGARTVFDDAADLAMDTEYLADEVVQDSVRVGSDVTRTALVAPVAVTHAAVSGTLGLATAGVHAVRDAIDPTHRAIVMAHVRSEAPDVDDEDAELIADQLMHPDNKRYLLCILQSSPQYSGASASTPAATTQQATAPAAQPAAGSRATTLDARRQGTPVNAGAHASGPCTCYECVTAAAKTPAAGARETAPPPQQQQRASSSAAEEYRRKWGLPPNGNGHVQQTRGQQQGRGGQGQGHQQSARRDAGSRESELDRDLRAAGFEYSCHMCDCTVHTSHCTQCNTAVPEYYIDKALGSSGQSAAAQFIDGATSAVSTLNIQFGF